MSNTLAQESTTNKTNGEQQETNSLPLVVQEGVKTSEIKEKAPPKPQGPPPQTEKSPSQPIQYHFTLVNQAKNQKPYHRRRPANTIIDSLFCHNCDTKKTPEWRTGPDGPATLCNACGLKYAKEKRRQVQNESQQMWPVPNGLTPEQAEMGAILYNRCMDFMKYQSSHQEVTSNTQNSDFPVFVSQQNASPFGCYFIPTFVPTDPKLINAKPTKENDVNTKEQSEELRTKQREEIPEQNKRKRPNESSETGSPNKVQVVSNTVDNSPKPKPAQFENYLHSFKVDDTSKKTPPRNSEKVSKSS